MVDKNIGHRQACQRWYQKNKEKAYAGAIKWRLNNPDRVKESKHKYYIKNQSKYLLKLYGITLEGRSRLKDIQQHTCAICGKSPKKFFVDHCHRTQRVRGLLCLNCNSILGHSHDSPTILQSAIDYLNSPPSDLTTVENNVKS